MALGSNPSHFLDDMRELPKLQIISLNQLTTFPLLRLCSGLRSFEWRGGILHLNESLGELTAFLKQGHHKQLDSLRLYSAKNDEQLSLCLGATDRLKLLDLTNGIVGLDLCSL